MRHAKRDVFSFGVSLAAEASVKKVENHCSKMTCVPVSAERPVVPRAVSVFNILERKFFRYGLLEEPFVRRSLRCLDPVDQLYGSLDYPSSLVPQCDRSSASQ